MALKDCIRKLGKLIDKDDQALLQSWMDEGMSDEAVVQRYLLASEMDMLDTLRKAKVSGEIQIRVPEVRAKISEYATAAFDKAEKEYNSVLSKVDKLQEEWSRINWIKETVQYFTATDEDTAAVARQPIDLNDDVAVQNRLSAMFFANPELFRQRHLGEDLLWGNSPIEIFNSWVEMLDRQAELVRELEPLIAQKVELENRMEDLDRARYQSAQYQRVTFDQGPIDDGKPGKTERDQIQEEIDFLADPEADKQLEAVAAKGSTNAGRILKLLGPALYGDMDKIQAVTVKELFQNAYDAVRTNLNKGAIEEGSVEVTISEDKRSVTVKDNGVGMTPDMINDGFLRVAGTEKEGDVNSGGFGIAKVLFLAGNKSLKLVTIRDGIKTTLETTGEDFALNMEDPEHSLNQRYPADRVLRREKTDEPNGTTVTVTMPDNYVDFRTGETKDVQDLRVYDLWETTDHQLLDPRIVVKEQNRTSPSGKNFKFDEYNIIQKVKFEWGEIDIYMSKDERTTFGTNATIAVHGLKQFEMGIKENPAGVSSLIKRAFHIDVKPSMEPGAPGYPFNLQRQGFVDHAGQDFLQLQFYLAVLNARSKAEEVAQGYGQLVPLREDGNTDPELRLEPPPRTTAGLLQRLDEGQHLEVRDGVLIVDGIEQEKIDPDQMEEVRRSFQTEEFQVDQSLIPRDKPLLHNQQKFKDDENQLSEDTKEYAGKDFLDALYDKFGEERVHKYFYAIGNIFGDVRDLIAVKGDKKMFGGLDKIGVGVSVLGNNHYGVHTKVPGQMMFVNPGHDPREKRGRYEVGTGEQKADVTAASMLTVMLHEIAHYAEWSHDMDYIFALQNAMATAIQEPAFMDGARKKLKETLSENQEIFKWITDALENETLEIVGNSIQDVGTSQAGDRGGPADVTGPDGRRAQREGAAEQDRQGAGPAQGVADSDRVAAGYREGEVVVPRGAVNPQAGQQSQINKLIPPVPSQADQTQTQAFKLFFEGSKVVDENGNPRVVYHGTQSPGAEFTEFVPQGGFGGWNNMGSWFSSEREHAERLTENLEPPHGGVIPAYLSIKNPLETDWDTLQNEIRTAIDNYNKDNPSETPLNPWGGTQGETSRVGKFLKGHFKKLGYDGIIIKAFEGDGQPTQDVYVAFDSNQIKHATRNKGTFATASQNIYEQDRRGFIEFDEMRKAYIRLTQASDLSTFIHESGHLYLELLKRLALLDDVPDQIKNDWALTKQYLEEATGIPIIDNKLTVEHHEHFAKSFEKYALEGKAPSLELQDAFNSFRRWLMGLYRKLQTLAGIELTDEIRGVMDRMLATDEQIKLAEEMQGFSALFLNAEEAGMSQEQFGVYKKRLQRTHDDAVDRETRRLIQWMRRDQLAWLREERKKVEAQVTQEAHEAKVYVALAFLQKGQNPDGSPADTAPFKIDKKSLLNLLSGDQSIINRLPKPYIYTSKEGGVDVEVAAQMFGYKDALAMLKAMIETPRMDKWIRAETDRRMLEIYPDPLTDGTLADNAVRAVHDTKRAEILAEEMRVLRRMVREDRPAVRAAQATERRQDREAQAANRAMMPKRQEIQFIRAAARESIARKKIRDIRPHVYLAAERKAGRLAFEAMRRRDYQAAYQHKLQQIQALEMYRAAVKAEKDAKAGQKYLKKFNRSTVQRQKKLRGVIDNILAILEGVDLRQRSLSAIDLDKRLKQLRDEVEAGRFIVTRETMARIFDDRVNWKELTLDEFLGMRDLVKQIEHSAVAIDKHYVNGEWIEFSEVEAEVATSLHENNKRIDFRPGGQKTGKERLSKDIDQGIATWLRPSSIARVLDKSGFGAMTRRIIAPMRRAYAEKLIPMLHKAQADVAKLYQQHYSFSELAQLSKRNIRIDSMDTTFSRSELLTMALNWGSETNRLAVLGGVYEGQPVYPQEAIDEMLAHLTSQDWGFVQAVWDYLDTYREELFAAEKRRRGVAPQKVEPVPFTIMAADGVEVTLAGGYFPLRYDPTYEPEVQPQEITEEFKRVAFGSMVTANTRAGATFNRTKNHGKVIRLGLNTIDSHLREVIRDIAIGDEVLYIKRLLDSREVRKAFKETGNEAAMEALGLWLTDAAVGELPSENAIESVTSWIRTGFTKAKLGWNMAVMFLQFTGAFQTMAVIGSANYAAGLGKFMQNPRAAWKHVMETSKFLHTRYEVGAWDKDVQDTRAHLESIFGTTPTRGKVFFTRLSYTYFLPIAKAQQVVDITTWLGAYHKGLNELNLGEQDAIIYADTQVEASQTSGFFSDRSGFERGTSGLRKNRQSQFIRIWTTLISYMLAKGNIAYEKTKTTNFRSPSQVAKYMADMFLLFTVEGMASAVLYGRLPEEDDEPEDWVKWAAVVTVDSAVSGVPYAREVLAAKYGGGNTPVGVFLNDSWRLIEQGAQGEADTAAVDAFLDVVGTATHTPTGQISKTFRAIWDDDDTELWEYLMGPSKD
jgi:hypothetical protein